MEKSVLLEIEENCWGILEEINQAGYFVTCSLVIQVLLDRYSILSFEQLGCGESPFVAISVLSQLNKLEHLTQSFLNIICGCADTRSIVSLVDIEKELCEFLKGCGVKSFRKAGEVRDPNELLIDEANAIFSVDGEAKPSSSCFEDFGVGKLCWHPTIQRLFPGLEYDCLATDFPDSAAILRDLSEFLYDENIGKSCRLSSPEKFSVEQFEAFVCMKRGCYSLQQIGVRLRGNMTTEVLICNKIVSTRLRYAEDLLRTELMTLGEFQQELFQYQEITKRMKRLRERNTNDKKVSLSSISGLSAKESFVELCSSRLHNLRGGSPYSPSYSQVEGVVQDVLERAEFRQGQCDRDISSAGGTTQKQRKRNRNFVGNSSSQFVSADEVKMALADYVMLHVGGKKYLQKRLQMDGDDNNIADSTDQTFHFADQVEASDSTDKVADSADQTFHSADQVEASDSTDHVADSTDNAITEPLLQSQELELEETLPDLSDGLAALAAGSSIVSSSLKSFGVTSPSPKPDPAQAAAVDPSSQFEARITTSNESIAPMDDLLVSVMQVGNSRVSASVVRPLHDFCEGYATSGIGKWGEALVYQYLLLANPGSTVNWVNKERETLAPYDIIVKTPTGQGHQRTNTVYVEVKTSRFETNNVFEISWQEFLFATGQPRVQYSVYRVFAAQQREKAFIHIISDVLTSIEAKAIKLCLAI